MHPANNPWLDLPALNDRLIELHAEDDGELSFREITRRLNEQFGTRLTRFAVIGRSHRLGLPRRVVKIKERAPKKRRARAMIKPKPQAPIPPPEIHGPRRKVGVTFAELDLYRGCHWPYGDLLEKATLFCGKDALEGSSWCAEHHGKVYDRARKAG